MENKYKHNKQKYSFIKCFCILNIFVIFITGCANGFLGESENKKEFIKTGFAFNTTYTITLNAGGSEELLNECVSKCSEYEKVFSRTLEGSEIYNINEIEKAYLNIVQTRQSKKNNKENIKESIKESIKSKTSLNNNTEFNVNNDGSISFIVSELLYKILEKGLYYSEMSDGNFDITIEPESSLWNFTAENPEVPEHNQIKTAAKLVNYHNAELKDKKLILKVAGMGIELGAIAKGFIADDLKKYLESNGVTSGTVNLGGNVLCIGRRADGEPFHIGIQQPFADRNEIITAINADGVSVVSSGIYERYFMQDEKIYHHILNPSTGYPYDNGLVAVTIVSEKSVDGDALSTTCFALGLDKGMELVNSLDNVYALFITEDEELYYSKGFKEMETK